MRLSLNQLRTRLLGKMSGRGADGALRQGGDAQAGTDPGTTPEESPWGPLALAHTGIVRLNPQGQIIEANEPALAQLHCTLDAVLGHDFWDAVPEDITEQYQAATGKALSASPRHAFVAHHKFEGSWVEYVFKLQPSGAIVTLRDVASAQSLLQSLGDSESYNQLLFDAHPTAMWLFARSSLRIVAANQAAVRFYGIDHKEFVTLHIGALFPDGEGAALLNSLAPGRAVPFKLRVCKQRKMDGQLVLVELAWGHVNWRGQQAVLVSLADVTELHLSDRALRRANAGLAEELARQRSELENTRHDLAAFTAAVSSDLQDSLHVANGFATTLAEKYSAVLDSQGRHYVSRIQASTRQLARLVDDLRTLAQLPLLSGKPENIDLLPVCHALIADLRKREPGRVVTIELAGSMPLFGDVRLLTTALACLLDNAWKFTAKRAEAWIKVALAPGKTASELVLQVSDNGAGFDAAYGDRLFTAFARLHSSADFPGNGLGLAIVRGVAARHGGTAWAETTEQVGSSFFMALPQGAVRPG
ncbi:MAG: PAS domain-containing sensor histidine kinase [Polaromonas sp.]